MDLVIRGGTVVTVGETFVADVGVEGGKVTQIGGEMSGAREIDAAASSSCRVAWTCTSTCS